MNNLLMKTMFHTTLIVLLATIFNNCTLPTVRTAREETGSPCPCMSNDSFPEVPGVVVSYSPDSSGRYIGSPSIAVLPNGHYIASHDYFGPNSQETTLGITKVFRSVDGGKQWSSVSEINGQFWSQLFVHRDTLYLIGTEKVNGDIVIRRSADEGVSWTSPTTQLNGRLTTGGRFHGAPTPVISHQGRLWKGMEDVLGGGSVWGQGFRAFVMSVADSVDLLKASNWTFSNRMGFNPSYLNGDFGGWLEGNAVVAPGGGVVNLLRTHYGVNGDELLSVMKLNAGGTTATFDPDSGFVDFPGGCKKFAVRRDPYDLSYWSLTNYVPDRFKGNNPERTRNTVALLRSTDLVNWEVRAIVLHHPDISKHGFQYLDFQFVGTDIVCVSRTAYDDYAGGADSQHNANFLTFHRIRDFRNVTSPPQWAGLH